MPTEELFNQYQIDKKEYSDMKSKGFILNLYRTLSGKVEHNYVAQPAEPQPSLVLVEKYRLSTYLGRYGAGRTINTFSLLPGEKSTIAIKTYKKTEISKKEASSILDSVTDETSDEFEKSLQDEESTKTNTQDTFNYHAESNVHQGWGSGSADVSGGIAGSSTSAREEFAKNVAASTQKNSSKASAKRDMQVDTSFESKEEAGSETAITREIRNINVGRTLNFVFRQMNQEFITFLHLVDVRVAFFNGFRGSAEEVPLADLDNLLAKYIVPAKRIQVKETILAELKAMRDYKDNPVSDYIEPFPNAQRPLYWRVKRGYATTYEDETGNRFVIPGLIVRADKNVMRTDGVIVESLLGAASGLDSYSEGLQVEKVRSQQLDNLLKELAVKRAESEQRILDAKDEAAAKVHQLLFPPAPSSASGKSAEVDPA